MSNLIKKTFGGEDPRHYGIILAAEGGEKQTLGGSLSPGRLAGCLYRRGRGSGSLAKASRQAKKICVFSTLHYWVEQSMLVALGLAGMGHEVNFAWLPYAAWDLKIDLFDLRKQDLYTWNILAPPAAKVMQLNSLLKARWTRARNQTWTRSCAGSSIRSRITIRNTPCRLKKPIPVPPALSFAPGAQRAGGCRHPCLA